MISPAISEIALWVYRAKAAALEAQCIHYVYVHGDIVDMDTTPRPGYVAKCYPGGRTELRGAWGEQVKAWQEQQAGKESE